MDLTDVHILILVRLAYIPSVAFLVPKDKEEEYQPLVFHLSIPMVYVESAPLFFVTTDMVKDRVKNTMQACGESPFHPLEQLE